MKDLQDIAQEIGMNIGYLRILSRNHDKCYQSYYLAKKSGARRVIDAPNSELKAIQRWILRNVLDNQSLNPCVHGFRAERGIKTNARRHLGKHFIMCLDIKDFFPSIRKAHVFSIFRDIFNDEKTADVLSNLCTYKERLPQGGVTSPALSNIVLSKIDEAISSICGRKRVIYTRYADDLAFSANNFNSLEELKPQIDETLRRGGFELNKKKTRFFRGKGRMLVTGLVLNSGKLTVGRSRKREIRAALFNHIVKGDKKVNVNKLFGTLAFIRDIEPDFYERFRKYRSRLEQKRRSNLLSPQH